MILKKAKWEEEKKEISSLKDIKEEIDRVKREIEDAERKYDLERLSELKYGKLPELESKLENLSSKNEEDRMLKEEVTEEEIAEVVSKWTGIPVYKLVATEREKLLNLDKILEKES